jgi:hypothetical protein
MTAGIHSFYFLIQSRPYKLLTSLTGQWGGLIFFRVCHINVWMLPCHGRSSLVQAGLLTFLWREDADSILTQFVTVRLETWLFSRPECIQELQLEEDYVGAARRYGINAESDSKSAFAAVVTPSDRHWRRYQAEIAEFNMLFWKSMKTTDLFPLFVLIICSTFHQNLVVNSFQCIVSATIAKWCSSGGSGSVPRNREHSGEIFSISTK